MTLPSFLTWENGIKINVADPTFTSAGMSVYLKATTVGGSFSDPPKEIKISFKCSYTVEELNTDEVIVPFSDNQKFQPFSGTPFDGKFTFNTNDQDRCQYTHLYLYESEADFNGNVPKAADPIPFDDEFITMTTDTQGKYEYFFTITGNFDANGDYIKSNLGKATVFICGKELITPKMAPENRPIGLSDADTRRIIPFEDYESWFEITAPTD